MMPRFDCVFSWLRPAAVVAMMAALLPALALAADWSAPVEVYHDDRRCITYRALWTGEDLVVEAVIEPRWHTFAMDNKKRQAEKLAGKPSLGIEKPTEIKLEGGLEVQGGWRQSPPSDFSKPEIQWYSFGFEQKALFAVKAKTAGSGPAAVRVRAQACSDNICKNIDVVLTVPTSSPGTVDVSALIPLKL
ncbi:MAG: hypothetical protein NTV70_03030 [Acidobacteria bacterium]|nr:hypothetical protein [Acidobacteriota bacterium]